MFKKFMSFVVLTVIFSLPIPLIASSNPLSPGTPVQVTTTNDVFFPPVVTGATAGYMIASQTTGGDSYASFSADNGASWATNPISDNPNFFAWIASNNSGFMSTWISPTIGGPLSDYPAWYFSVDNGVLWTGDGNSIAAIDTVISPLIINGTNAGFMAVWLDIITENIFASFTSNAAYADPSPPTTTTWSTPVNVSNVVANGTGVVAGNSAGFMVTWADTSNNGYASFSSDNGSSWTTNTITPANNVYSQIWVAANSSGFMATWCDTAGNAYASFSSDNGTTWSNPAAILTTNSTNQVLQLMGYPFYTEVSVAANELGFVAAWIGTDSNAYGSFSTGGSAAWSEPVMITTDGSVSIGNVNSSVTFSGFVSVACTANGCLFTWLSNDSNTYASYANLATPSYSLGDLFTQRLITKYYPRVTGS